MATINVLTLEAAQAILDESVVSGEVNGSGHLILTKHDGSTFDAGDFSAAITALINTTIAATTLIELLVSSNAVGDIPLRVRGMASQTGDLQQWQNSAGSVLARVKADGTFTAVDIENTTIDGDKNTLDNINAEKVDGKRITVNAVAPSSPSPGDIWINPTGA